MKQGHITFKFKCENQFDTIKFQGESITLNEVKKLVAMNRKLDTTKEFADYDFKISDYQSKQGLFLNYILVICNELEYIQENQKIPQNTQLLVERIKLGLDKPIQYVEKDQQQQKCVMSQPSTFATKNEYLCKICNNYLQTPILTSCCTESACKICYDEKLKTLNGKCFFCNQIPDRSYVINQALQNILTKILSQNTQNQAAQQMQQKQTGLVSIYDEPYRNEDNELEEMLNNAKYFIMKSVNQENIQIAYQHQEWSTTLYNQQKLIEAYSTCKNVILLYSVNKSGRFAGFARMDSPVQQYQSQFWKDKDFIKLGGVFKIKWIKFCSLEFYKIQNFKNPLNQNEPIKKSRDAQEIPADIGKKICKMFNEEENEVQYQPTYYQTYNQQQGGSYWPCNYQQPSFGNQINKGQLFSNQQFNVDQTGLIQQIEEQQEQVQQNETKQTQLLDLYEDIQPSQVEKQQNNDKLKENLQQLLKLKEQKQLETAQQVLQQPPEETKIQQDQQQNFQLEADNKKIIPTPIIDPSSQLPQAESIDYFNLPYQDQVQQPGSHKQSMDDSLSNQNKQLFPGQTPPPPPFNYNQFMPFPPQLFAFYNQFNQQSANLPMNMNMGYYPPGAAAMYPPFMTKQKQEIESNDNSSNSSDSQTKKKSRKHKKQRKDKEKDKERDRRKHKSEHRADRDSVQKKVKKH